MDYPHSPSSPSFPSSADKPDGLLADLYEAQITLVIAEHHIRLWRENSAPGNRLFCQRNSCVAHEALHEAGKTIERVAETLKIQVNSTLATQQRNSAHVYTESIPEERRPL